ncbi:HET protein [Pochonia chlamydosporia 170]|uniref:HET protein n=1 Tax=Pochonia chlamydosporia 170 TaxID=1380566 RepID=A0A179F551_METCM|nr:HET protein [Pochonia chlamydosporia 170]OAQ60556.1 HET protein [Pochonia chlamydosporia 170]
MRLINTRTGLFEEFIGRNIPPYAILSHTWDDEEVSFQDMTSNPSCMSMKGFQKIQATCQMACDADLTYAWVDTCCIDKTSSAELTEAINSMYLWYQRSKVCYVYLADMDPSSDIKTALPNCCWFTRGWTLQELIAPDNVVFFDQEWNRRGEKRNLLQELFLITGIGEKVLDHTQPLSSMSVAQKMSWAAHRATTRIEDIAYSLLGIFGVNMPLMYGEEDKAFRRLQEEIMRTTPDLSLFAWRLPPPDDAIYADTQKRPSKRVYCGFLADSPLAFSQAGSLAKRPFGSRREFAFSNCGIKTQVQTWSYTKPKLGKRSYLLPLDCSWDPDLPLGVLIKKCGPDQFLREDPWNLVECRGLVSPNPPLQRYLLTDLSEMTMDPNKQLLDSSRFLSHVRPHVLQLEGSGSIDTYEVWSRARWDDEDFVFFVAANPSHDSSFMTLGVRLQVNKWGVSLPEHVTFKVICFVVGWASPSQPGPQITLLDYKKHPMMDEVLARIKLWDPDTHQLWTQLRLRGIPRSPEAVFAIPETDLFARVYYTLELVTDPEICARQFWKLHIASEVCSKKDLKPVSDQHWTFDRVKHGWKNVP